MKTNQINFKETCMVIMAAVILASCAAPVNSSFEGARTVPKGNVEVAGNYSSYSFSVDGESEKMNQNYGIRLGYGISDKFDLKFKYESINPPSGVEDYEGSTSISYLALTPKYNIVDKIASTSLTIGTYLSEGESYYFFGPKFILSFPVKNNFEPVFAVKTDIFPSEDEYFLGFNFGFGISSDLDKWAIRPEFGIMKDLQDFNGSYTTWGIGLNYNFKTSK